MDTLYLDECKRSSKYAFAYGWLSAAAGRAADKMEAHGLVGEADALREAVEESLARGAEHAAIIWGDGQ